MLSLCLIRMVPFRPCFRDDEERLSCDDLLKERHTGRCHTSEAHVTSLAAREGQAGDHRMKSFHLDEAAWPTGPLFVKKHSGCRSTRQK